MKLKNKKTGFVTNWCIDKDIIRTCDGSIKYNSLVELNAEWEDYEEPKTHWAINQFGDVIDEVDGYMIETVDEMKQIGNYFETREEAERAVEKLKAWKRLKDKGFRITDWGVANGNELRFFGYYSTPGIKDDLDLLFGGEE